MSKVLFPGFFRIATREKKFDAFFLPGREQKFSRGCEKPLFLSYNATSLHALHKAALHDEV